MTLDLLQVVGRKRNIEKIRTKFSVCVCACLIRLVLTCVQVYVSASVCAPEYDLCLHIECSCANKSAYFRGKYYKIFCQYQHGKVVI